jgi:YfiH family protein
MNDPSGLTVPVLRGVEGLRHRFFTRRGGVSTGLYDSMNVGLGSRDDPAAVRENRRLAALAFGRPGEALVTAYQVHSAIALRVEGPWPGEVAQADALVSNRPGVILGALAADCAPVLIVDPVARVIAAVHAGWRGALGGVIEAAVDLMLEAGAARHNLIAGIGPCIGPASYEVGLDFVETFEAADPGAHAFFVEAARPDKCLFDLPAYALARLCASGVERAEWIGRDTCAEADDFFSNRRALHRGEADYGRLLSAIMLEPPA